MAAAEVWRCCACGLPAPGRCERCTDPTAADDKRDAAKLAELGQAGLFPAGTLPPRRTARGQSLLDI